MHLVIEALGDWSTRSKAGILLGLALFAASVAPARADVVEALQGAWVLESSDCTKVFEKIQGQIRFKDRNFVADSGFIISGNKAKGPAGGICTISEIDEENDRFSALLSCTDTLVSRNFSMLFRVVDATHFERLDPTFPDRPIAYKKCVF
jgi:hypothetical protein